MSLASPSPLDGLELPPGISHHKLFPPPVYPNAVRRERLLQRVLQEGYPCVTVLHGPAGHGKSTTMQQLLSGHASRGWRTAWLTLDDADNDPRRFESHFMALLALLQGLPPPLGEMRVETAKAFRGLADAILDRLAEMEAPAVFALDEFHVLQNEGILRFFRSLLARLPPHVRVFIGSRTLPDVGVATLLAHQKVSVWRVEDLRFMPDEADLFFAASAGLDLDAEEVRAIYRRTEGWPAGLQLFRLALASPEVRTSLDEVDKYRAPRELAEYLADNVVTLQSPRIQEFLLKTSVLRRLCAPLCTAVTGFDDAQDILVQLERSGLFLHALDADNRWFKYHGLFASFLSDALRRISAAQVATSHHRAAHWYQAHQMPEECLHHAVSCHNFTLATAALTAWSAQLISSANLVTLEHWYDRLPFHQVATQLPLMIRTAYALAFLRRRSKLQPLIDLLASYTQQGSITSTTDPDLCRAMSFVITEDNLEAALDIINGRELFQQEGDAFAAFELGAAANVLAYGRIASGDFEGARKALMLAAVQCSHGAGAFVSEYMIANTGISLLLQGRLREANEQLRTLGLRESPLDKSVASAARAAIHIWALYEADDLPTVETLGRRFQRDISESAAPHFIAVAYLSLARMHDLLGRPAEARQVLDELERIGQSSGWKRLLSVVEWERVRRALAEGEIGTATALAARIPASCARDGSWLHPSEDIEGEAYGRIRLAIAQGDHAAASQRIARERARQPGRILRQIKLGIFDALLHQRQGAPQAARRSLRATLHLAREGRYVRCLLDEGEVIVQMLRQECRHMLEAKEAEHRTTDLDYVQHLLQAAGSPSALAHPQGGQVVEPLSEREKEMLHQLANGASNKELAYQLFVSENTVKFHLKNIYAKLGVNSRLQAIHIARIMRLVS